MGIIKYQDDDHGWREAQEDPNREGMILEKGSRTKLLPDSKECENMGSNEIITTFNIQRKDQ